MSEEVKNLLTEVQLESFFVKVRDLLQITRLEHFKNVKTNDLAGIGMSKPAIRRLKMTLKERTATAKPGFQKFAVLGQGSADVKQLSKQSLACLIAESELDLGDKLGDGSFGTVKKALWKKTEQYVAVKVLKRDLITNDQVLEDFISEVNIMHKLSHRHLVKLHGVCLGPQHMMVTELAPYGSLLDHVHRNHSQILLSTLHTYAYQLSDAMSYLESKGYIHRDVALRNIFLLNLEHIKLGDFGLTRVLKTQHDVYIMAPERKVPYAWCAPESLKRREFTHAADAWMYAVTLWELFSFGQEPWMGFNGAQILYLIDTDQKRLSRPDSCPTSTYQMMLQCWLPDPDDRPTFSAIKQFLSETHPIEMRAKQAFSGSKEKRKLVLEIDDMVLVVDGRSEKRWWYGQNKRTLAFGHFPRPVVDPLRPLTVQDISRPIPSTFVHIGSSESGSSANFKSIASTSELVQPDMSPFDSQQLSQEDPKELNPTYLPCRKSLGLVPLKNTNGQTVQRDFFLQSKDVRSHNPKLPAKKTEHDAAPLCNGEQFHKGSTDNPFATDVFMPELFAVPQPAAKETSKKLLVNGNHQVVKPSGQSYQSSTTDSKLSRNFSIIDRSSEHYTHLPMPLVPPPSMNSVTKTDNQQQATHDPFLINNEVRQFLEASTTQEDRSRRSAPSDGNLPIVPLSPENTSYGRADYKSPAGDLVTSNLPFSYMHSQFANIFINPTRSSSQPLIQVEPISMPIDVNPVHTKLYVELPPSSRRVPSAVITKPAAVTAQPQAVQVQADVHRPAVANHPPLLPGNYRTAKFLEMSSLSPSRQQKHQQTNYNNSKYTRSADVLSQLRGTIELSQHRRTIAEQSKTEIQELESVHVNQLAALGLASKEYCRQLLIKHKWDVELAGAELADKACKS